MVTLKIIRLKRMKSGEKKTLMMEAENLTEDDIFKVD